jgi:protein-S-isoprenylcysteine O-methyltransferase Ste14
MNLVRIFLLSGLLFHKLVWELLKPGRSRSSAEGTRAGRPFRVVQIKTIKIGILLFIIAQTMLPEILPIDTESNSLRPLGLSLYAVGLAIALVGRIQLGTNWSDIESAKVLHNQRVVSKGIYGYVRHPIYVGDLLLLLGLELSLNSWLVLGVVLIVPIVLFKAVSEEKMLRERLPGYEEYCLHTKRFIPYLI